MLLESLLTHLVSKDYELIGRLAMHQSFVSTPPHIRDSSGIAGLWCSASIYFLIQLGNKFMH